jgi:hypothetical protein
MKTVIAAAVLIAATPAAAAAQSVTRVYTKFDSKQCHHERGRAPEDYGSWRCTGHDGIEVRLSAGDHRMQVSFGREAARELAARQTNGKHRPFTTILRWNVKLEGDERDSTGRVLVVTRLASDTCPDVFVSEVRYTAQ